MTDPTLALPSHLGREILRCEVGSTLHGTGLPGGEDLDLMGIYIEPPVGVLGMSQHPHWISRTAGEGEKSNPGDVDLVMYSARKWAGLALKGNPSVLLLLHATQGPKGAGQPRFCRRLREGVGRWVGVGRVQRPRRAGDASPHCIPGSG